MKKYSTVILTIGLIPALFSCGTKELREQNISLQSELDSISIVLDETEKAVQTLTEIQVLLDTIESKRNIVRMEMVEGGIRYEDYVARVEALNTYLEQAENRIAQLEKAGRSSGALIKNLRNEINEKNQQIEALESILNDYKANNAQLSDKIQMQESEIAGLELEIISADVELKQLESKIEEMVEVSKMTEADGYYARAVAYEEAASRTKLAPRKKKETLTQALELYRKAQEMGHEGAQTKIDELSKKVE